MQPRRSKDPIYEATGHVNLARLMCIMGKAGDDFEENYQEARRLCLDTENDFRRHLAQLDITMAEYYVVTKKPAEASEHAAEAYQSAYSFNRYIANDIHAQMMNLVQSQKLADDVKVRAKRYELYF